MNVWFFVCSYFYYYEFTWNAKLSIFTTINHDFYFYNRDQVCRVNNARCDVVSQQCYGDSR